MKTLISSLLLAIAIPTLHAELPAEAQELLSKLEDWEIEQQAELQKRVQAKRAEVSNVLERLLVERTKSGDLDGALAVKTAIEALTTTGYGKDGPAHESASSMKNSVEFDPANTTWMGSKGPMEGWVFEFGEDGAMVARRPDGQTFEKWKWKIDEAEHFYIKGAAGSDEFQKAEIRREGKEFEWALRDGVELTEFERKN